MKYQIGDRIVILFTKYRKEFVTDDRDWIKALKDLQDERGCLFVKSKSPNCRLWLCNEYRNGDCDKHQYRFEGDEVVWEKCGMDNRHEFCKIEDYSKPFIFKITKIRKPKKFKINERR